MNEEAFSVLDTVDGEFIATNGQSGERLCISVFLDPAKPDVINFCAKLPVLDEMEEMDLSLLLSEILNSAAVAWRTHSRAALILRQSEYLCVNFEESSIKQPIPTIRISNVQHDDPAHANTSPHPWGFTLLNITLATLAWWFNEGSPGPWQSCEQNQLYVRPCEHGGLVEALSSSVTPFLSLLRSLRSLMS